MKKDIKAIRRRLNIDRIARYMKKWAKSRTKKDSQMIIEQHK